ncbi:MAG: TRAP transporter large permease subunit [Acutalibacteraceae bacterium]
MLSIPLPVCFAGALLFLSLFGDVSMKTMLIWVFSQSTGTVLLASPLFILAGTYMGGSGISKTLAGLCRRICGSHQIRPGRGGCSCVRHYGSHIRKRIYGRGSYRPHHDS